MEIVYSESQCKYGQVTLRLIDAGEATEHLNMLAGEIKNHIDNDVTVYLKKVYDSDGATVTEIALCDAYAISGNAISFHFTNTNTDAFYNADSMDDYPVLHL